MSAPQRAVVLALVLCGACGGSVIDGVGVPTWKDGGTDAAGAGGNAGSAGMITKDGGVASGGMAGQPGICRAFCCSSLHCAPGVACESFLPTFGALGVCDGDGAISSSGGPLPAGCWTEPMCNPLTNEGCSPGDACDYAQNEQGSKAVVACFGGDDYVQGPGDPCDNVYGPLCKPTLHCAP